MKKKGFTLIELLVVIAIIALLLSVLMPSLQKAKAKAREIFSLSNMRSLMMGWTMYHQDNNSKLVSGEVWVNNTINTVPAPGAPNGIREHDWVHPLVPSDGIMSDHERELAGIRRGALWRYLEDVDVYNSPSDPTKRQSIGPYTMKMSPFRSYAISDAMAGDWYSAWNPEYVYHNMDRISRPAERIVFLEEEDNGGENWGSWILSNSWWHDPLAAWYGSKKESMFGFADGRAAKHRWTEESTFFMLEHQDRPSGGFPHFDSDQDVDIEFMMNAYHENYP